MNGLCDSEFTTADKRLGVSHLTLYFYIDLLHVLIFSIYLSMNQLSLIDKKNCQIQQE